MNTRNGSSNKYKGKRKKRKNCNAALIITDKGSLSQGTAHLEF